MKELTMVIQQRRDHLTITYFDNLDNIKKMFKFDSTLWI